VEVFDLLHGLGLHGLNIPRELLAGSEELLLLLLPLLLPILELSLCGLPCHSVNEELLLDLPGLRSEIVLPLMLAGLAVMIVFRGAAAISSGYGIVALPIAAQNQFHAAHIKDTALDLLIQVFAQALHSGNGLRFYAAIKDYFSLQTRFVTNSVQYFKVFKTYYSWRIKLKYESGIL
jgi:hypothetical protein